MSETLQSDLVETDGGAIRALFAPLVLVGNGEHRAAVAAVLEEGGIEFDAGEAAVGLDPARPPAAVILCPAGTLAAAGTEIAELHGATAAPLLVVCTEVRPGELRGALAAGATGVVLEATLAGTLAPDPRGDPRGPGLRAPSRGAARSIRRASRRGRNRSSASSSWAT